ncbi:MAG: ribosomal protein S18-alanine N-acetyltransferase [Gemmatimonadota bacterium]
MTVREATPSDLPAVLDIENASFVDPWSRDAFASSLALPHMRFLVAESEEGGGGRPVGYVILTVVGPESEVADIAVDPAFRSGGVGGLLLDAAIARLASEGVEWLYLEVREMNSAARALYQSRAFFEVGRRRNYYRNPTDDALVLKREIAPL